MTKEEKLLRAIGEIDDELILAAEDFPHNVLPLSRKKQWKKIAMTAACFLLIAGVWLSVDDLFRMGSSKPAAPEAAPQAPAATDVTTETNLELLEDNCSTTEPEETPAETPEMPAELTAGAPIENAPMEEQKQQPVEANPTTGGVGGSYKGNEEYLAYYLPVQPLQVSGESESLTVARSVVVDMSEVDVYEANENNSANVSDTYLLMNSISEPVTVDLQYLYGESLLLQNDVTMTVDGSAAGQTIKAGKGAVLNSGNHVVYNFESFTDFFTDETYNMPNIPYVENATIYRIHNVDAGRGNTNKKAIVVTFTAPHNVPVFFENLYGTMIDEGDCYRYEVDASLNFDEWKIIVCGDVKPDFEIDFIERKNDEKVFLKADYEMDVTEVKLDKLLEQEIRKDEMWADNKIPMDVRVSACRETLYDDYIFSNRTDTTELYYLVQDAFVARRYLSLNQTVTIPANSSVTVEIQMKKQMNWHNEDNARSIEILCDKNMKNNVTPIHSQLVEYEENIIGNDDSALATERYQYIIKPLLCDGVPLKQ